MKKSSYMTRAMQARDPRFATILGRLGYERTDMQAAEPLATPEDELKALREEYQAAVGKRPFHGWDADTLKAKIAEAKA
jgi:hypothetical protein